MPAVDRSAEQVRVGWLVRLDQGWHEVVDMDDRWYACPRPRCVALGFAGDVADVLAEAVDDDHEVDAAEDRTWYHLHPDDPVQVRIPCEVTR
jgi:hypothetical protein